MEQKEIREWGGVAYTNTEGAEIIKELDARTYSDEAGYNSIDELAQKVKTIELSSNLLPKKYGYDWEKGAGNTDPVNIQVGDELKKVGTLYPGYWVHLYVKGVPIDSDNPNDSVIIINSAEI